MNNLTYIIPAAIIGVGAAVGLAYAGGAFSTKDITYDTSFVDKAFSSEGGKRKKKSGNKKTKRNNK
jgi:hypothetical protein